MIVLAIDPGFGRLGWAVGQVLTGGKINLLSYGLIETAADKTLEERYLQIDRELTGLITEFAPQEAALETLFFFKNQKTVIQVAETRGVILSALLRGGIKVSQYSPPQIKAAAAGYGQADKKAIEKMVRLQLRLPPSQKIIDDTFDALAILITHAGSQKLGSLRQ